MTPELAAAPNRVTFLPLSYTEIGRYLAQANFDAALFSVSSPDVDDRCSFGPTVDFLAELWPTIPLRFAHINPALPFTAGPTGIARTSLTDWIECTAPVPAGRQGGDDPIGRAIAANVAPYIADGATLQAGVGKAPTAIVSALSDRRRLKIHSGLISDWAVDLLDAGAIEQGSDVTAGVAIGSARLYAALPASGIRFRPVSYTHNPKVIADLGGFIAINSAMEVDLFGQVYSEAGDAGWISGPGGAPEFMRGAGLAGGLRIVALPATFAGASRIVEPNGGAGPVTLSRFDVDIVATEYGAADLRGLDHDARAAALIAIAHPNHRAALDRPWSAALAERRNSG